MRQILLNRSPGPVFHECSQFERLAAVGVPLEQPTFSDCFLQRSSHGGYWHALTCEVRDDPPNHEVVFRFSRRDGQLSAKTHTFAKQSSDSELFIHEFHRVA
jgi:hypothetical protein